MQDFLRDSVSKLTIDERAASEAAGEILLVLRGRMEKVDFGTLLTAVPGAAELMAARYEPKPVKGVAGQLQKAASLLGQQPGGPLEATNLARKCGLAADSIGPFVALFLEYLRQRVSPDLWARIEKVAPELVALSRRS